MSLFGAQNSGGSSLFGANAQNDQQKPVNPFASMGTTQPAQQSGLFTSSPSNAANPSGSSLFGAATSQPQQSGGLFGAAASQPQQSGSLFGASTSQPQQTSSLFGAPAPQPQQSSSLFGSSTSQPQQTSSLFGAATSQPQTGGLFGATNQQGTGSVLGGTTTTSAPSLFGQTRSLADAPPLGSGGFGSTQQAQVSQAGSLFGATQQNQNQNQTQQSGTSLFGGASNQSKPTLSLFGANNNAQTTQPSLFSGSTLAATANSQQMPSLGGLNSQSTRPSQSLFGSTNARMPGSLTMGQTPAAGQQQTVPGVRIDVSNLRGTTRFNDLHDELQKQIEQIDNFIHQQIAFKEQCDALMPKHEQDLLTIPNDVNFVETKLEATESAIDGNSAATNNMKAVVQEDADNARVSFRAVENLKLPQQFHYSGIWQPTSTTITPPRGSSADRSSNPSGATESTDLVSYFNVQASSLSKTLETFKERMSEIETHLSAVEASTIAQSQQLMFQRGRDGGARSKEEQILELSAVLKEFEQGIEGVAGKVGGVRSAVVDVVEAGQRDVYGPRR